MHVLAPRRFHGTHREHVDELVVAEHAVSIAIVLVEHELEVFDAFGTQLDGGRAGHFQTLSQQNN